MEHRRRSLGHMPGGRGRGEKENYRFLLNLNNASLARGLALRKGTRGLGWPDRGSLIRERNLKKGILGGGREKRDGKH